MTTDYTGLKGIYFRKLLNTLVDVGGLNHCRVLDFGCGTQELRKHLLHKNYVGYDIKPELSDVPTLQHVKFDVMVANEVFYEMSEQEIVDALDTLKPKYLVVGISRKGLLNKIGAMLLAPDAHDHYKTTPEQELEILQKHYEIIRRKGVLFLADVYLLRRI